MACLSSARRAELLAEKARLEAIIEKLDAAYDSAIEKSEVESYSFGSGEGSQKATRRKPAEIREEISYHESKLRRVINKLNGNGLLNMNLRRKRFIGYY